MVKVYQWTKGDKQGNVVKSIGEKFIEDNIEYLVFSDGSMINSTLITEYLIEIPSEKEAIMLSDLAPQPMKRVERPRANAAPPAQNYALPQNPEVSPLEKLLADSKKSSENFSISVSVNLPSVDLLKILADSYENGEEQIIKFLASSIDLEDIKGKIASQIKEKAFQKKEKIKIRKNERSQSTI